MLGGTFQVLFQISFGVLFDEVLIGSWGECFWLAPALPLLLFDFLFVPWSQPLLLLLQFIFLLELFSLFFLVKLLLQFAFLLNLKFQLLIVVSVFLLSLLLLFFNVGNEAKGLALGVILTWVMSWNSWFEEHFLLELFSICLFLLFAIVYAVQEHYSILSNVNNIIFLYKMKNIRWP